MLNNEVATPEIAKQYVHDRLSASMKFRRMAVGLSLLAGVGASYHNESVDVVSLAAGAGLAGATIIENKRAYRHCQQTVQDFSDMRERQTGVRANPHWRTIIIGDGGAAAHLLSVVAETKTNRGVDDFGSSALAPALGFMAAEITGSAFEQSAHDTSNVVFAGLLAASAVALLVSTEADSRADRAGFMRQIDNIADASRVV